MPREYACPKPPPARKPTVAFRRGSGSLSASRTPRGPAGQPCELRGGQRPVTTVGIGIPKTEARHWKGN
jgi:hypothetical protein